MKKYLDRVKNIKGIIQIGSNSAREVSVFRSYTNNITLIEPLSSVCDYLKNQYPMYNVINCAIENYDGESTFHVSSNHGESSSLYEPQDHLNFYPHIKFLDKIKVKVRKASSLIESKEINISQFNVLFIDAQGSDLKILKSFENYIFDINLIITEYINSNLYINTDNTLENIQNYLTTKGFTFVECFGKEVNGAGNAVFIK